jgi:hypothetical protein
MLSPSKLLACVLPFFSSIVFSLRAVAREVIMRRLRYVGSIFGEIVQFARQNKVYWIVPLVLILGLVIVLVVTSQGVAPFIYTLF